MSGQMYGADVDELEALAKEFESYEQELGQLLREGVGAVSLLGLSATLNTIWMGPRSSEFAALWQSRHLLRIRDVQSTLSQAAADLRKNAAEQRQASSSTGASSQRSGPSYGTVPDFESRTGFSIDRSTGFVLRGGVKDGFFSSHGRNGSEVTYATEQYLSVESDDVTQALGFVATLKGKELESPVNLGVEVRGFSGTQFIWRQDFGSNESTLGGTGGIPTKMAEWDNLITGYTADEVVKDIEKGTLDKPDAIASYTGVSTASSISVENGASIFGAEGEVSVQRVLERRQDGTRVDTTVLTGSTSGSAGVHLDLGMNSGVDLVGVQGAEATVEVSTVYNASGDPVALEYKVIGHAEVGAKAELGFAGGGSYESSSSGVLVERTLTFDLTDPNVAEVVQFDGTTEGLAWHSEWASEEVRVFSTESSAQGADALLFKVDSESESMTLVDSQTRGPLRNDAVQTEHPGMTPQYVENDDGSRSTVWTGQY